MTCARVRSLLSPYLDGDLAPTPARAVGGHLESCADCARHYDSLQGALGMLADLPALLPSEGIASRVFDRLEVETRGPGLAMVFRSFRARRPLIFPSLVTSSLVVVAILTSAMALDRVWRSFDEPLPAVATSWQERLAVSGTEANPLFPSVGVSMPRERPGGVVPQDVLAAMGEGTLFLETVVARDGSVSTVTLLHGDLAVAQPVLDALRRQRFEPVQFRGRPVAVSVYRLISRMDVRSPLT
ncbi:MAG: zf-HC2 domain-containing protein [Solirubrobacterales bacterium]|jgi:anti-sigma factor RsiW